MEQNHWRIQDQIWGGGKMFIKKAMLPWRMYTMYFKVCIEL